MAFHPDVGLVDDRQRFHVAHAFDAAEAVGKGRPFAVAVPGLVQRQDNKAAPGELNGEAVLGLTGVDIAVDGQDAGGGGLCGHPGRDVEQSRVHAPIGRGKTHVFDGDLAEISLNEVGEQSPQQDQSQRNI